VSRDFFYIGFGRIDKVQRNIAKYIDHTLLNPDATQENIDNLINEAIEYTFKSVCVHPSWVKYCAQKLVNTEVAVCTVVGFPLGAQTIETKQFEAEDAMAKGATEIDMVINIGRLKSADYTYIEREIKSLVEVTRDKALLKVIIETALLSDDEKIAVLKIARNHQVDFVKTSTGFATGGATVADIKLMKDIVGDSVQIKASGGIRTLNDFQQMTQAGATRIGASAGIAIMHEINQTDNK